MSNHVKLLSYDGTGYVSLTVTGSAAVAYEPGVPTLPPFWLANLGYGLCVFDNLRYAMQFDHPGYNGITAWECECADEIRPLPPVLDGLYLHNGPEWYANGVHHSLSRRWPPGTRMFRTVTLLRRLDEEIAKIQNRKRYAFETEGDRK